MKAFSMRPETMVVTSTYVTENRLPILEVSHENDEEGGSLWQFHCGNGDYSLEQLQLVRLDTVLALDPSVVDVADLALGTTAKRGAKGLRWQITPRVGEKGEVAGG
jgi:hypothetical protein